MSEVRAVRLSVFASQYDYNSKTVARWCDEGMPHIGKGRARRVLVAQAIEWLNKGGAKAAAEKAGAEAHEEAMG